MAAILEVIDLVKTYPGVEAVRGISFSLAAGTCFGVLGPNGAGKTTTVEMIEGVTEPTSGEIRYKGERAGKRFRNEAGIQFQSTSLQQFLTVGESLKLFHSLYTRHANLEDVVEDCSLGDLLNRDTRKLSGGQFQRVLLAIALINDPDILFLDEPTTGLDPQARRNFWALVERIKARGKTIMLTTHYMDEAYVLCDKIAIMDNGVIIAQGSPDDLLRAHYNEVVMQLPADDMVNLPDDISSAPFRTMQHNGTVEIYTADIQATIGYLTNSEIPLGQLRIRPFNLEDLFLDLTGKELRA